MEDPIEIEAAGDVTEILEDPVLLDPNAIHELVSKGDDETLAAMLKV